MKFSSDDLFGLLLMALLAAVLGLLAFVKIPDDNVQLFTALASGVLGSGAGTFIGFKWGSSKSSQAKDATIASLADPTPPQTGA